MTEFCLRARPLGQDTYLPAEEAGLRAALSPMGGTGTLADPALYRVELENPAPTTWQGVFLLELVFPRQSPRFFLPGFLYGRNRGEAPLRVDNQFPRLRPGPAQRPAAPFWMVRGDRLTHPAAFALDGGRLYGLSAAPYLVELDGHRQAWAPGVPGRLCQFAGFACSLEKGTVAHTLGYENAPWLFIQSHNVRDRTPLGDNCLTLAPGERFAYTVAVYDLPADDPRVIYDAVAAVYRRWHTPPRNGADARHAVADIAGAVARDAWLPEESSYCGIVRENPDGTLDHNRIFSISWTNGLSVAVPMLLAAHRLKDETIRAQALQAIEYIARNALNPRTGLLYESWDEQGFSNRGWWFDGMHTGGHSGYLAGQSLYYLLKAFEYERRFGVVERRDWLALAESILERLNAVKNTDGEYPFILSEETGAGLEYDSLGSAWCLAAAALYARLTGDKSGLAEMERSEAHYYSAYVARAECYGGPLDTDKAIDNEGILAYIRAARLLHELTGREVYLDHLRDAFRYEFTFKFCYNTPIQTPPLGRLGWSCCGGSVTSVANPHIHPMSSTVLDEMLYLLDHRPDAYLAARLQDTYDWSRQNHNTFDREYDYGRTGWMSERFCFGQGLLVQRYPDGSPASTWFALMPWACASILEGLAGDCWDRPDNICSRYYTPDTAGQEAKS